MAFANSCTNQTSYSGAAGNWTYTTFITSDNWIRYVHVPKQKVKQVPEAYTATLVTDEDEDA